VHRPIPNTVVGLFEVAEIYYLVYTVLVPYLNSTRVRYSHCAIQYKWGCVHSQEKVGGASIPTSSNHYIIWIK